MRIPESYSVEPVSYDLIKQATNLNKREKNKLFGFTNQYVAAKLVGNGYEILMKTLGGRDECSRALQKLRAQSPNY